MVERCLVGWQEIEYEVMRDAEDTCIAVCSMENVDPLGVHTGDSIVVAPVQTLTDQVHQRLRRAALAIIRALGVEGGCNVQFALSPDSTEYAVIEVNPRVSRSSALASKATGYPIARVAAQIAAGRTLADIPNVVTGTTVAAFEPALDYVVVKLPRFPFDKFPTADRRLGSQMKATGEVMAIDRTFGAALNKALRGSSRRAPGRSARIPRGTPTFDYLAAVYAGDDGEPTTSLIRWIDERGDACESPASPSARPRRSCSAGSSSRRTRGCGGSSACSAAASRGDHPRGHRDLALVPRRDGPERGLEADVRASGSRLVDPADADAPALLATAKRAGFGDRDLAALAGVRRRRTSRRPGELGLRPGTRWSTRAPPSSRPRRRISTRPTPRPARRRRRRPSPRPAALVIGSGPVRIGQGIEFDYCAVQAADAFRRAGLERRDGQLEPRDRVDRLRRVDAPVLRAARRRERAERHRVETPAPGAGRSAGRGRVRRPDPAEPRRPAGRTPGAAARLDLETIDQAEERTRFSALLDRLGIPQPEGGMAESIEEALTLAERIGYPVIVRPSFVIGGLAIDFGYSPEDLVRQLAAATVVDPDRPVRIDRFLEGIEVDVDAVCDGDGVLIPGLLEHVERAGVHSGDSIGVFPPQHVSEGDQDLIVCDDGADLHRARRARPRQRAVHRARRRRVPDRGQPARLADGAVHVEGDGRADGRAGRPDLPRRDARRARLAGGLRPDPPFVAVKAPAFSTAKLKGVDPSVGPFMQSTGEVIGIADDARVAMAKALTGAVAVPPRRGEGEAPLALLSIADRDKWGLLDLARALDAAGYRLAATAGTRDALVAAGFTAEPVAKLGAEPGPGEAGILALIAGGHVRLVVNTPTPRSGAVRDAADIRHAAIAEGVLCLTAIETGIAAAEALAPDIADEIAKVRPITDWVPGPVVATPA